MRSRALNQVFNRALINLEYRRELLRNLPGLLRDAGVPEAEIELVTALSPRTIRELAEALERSHERSFQ